MFPKTLGNCKMLIKTENSYLYISAESTNIYTNVYLKKLYVQLEFEAINTFNCMHPGTLLFLFLVDHSILYPCVALQSTQSNGL